MPQPHELSPQEAVEKTFSFINNGVTGDPAQDQIAADSLEVVFGHGGQEITDRQKRMLEGLAKAYLDGGAPHLARILLFHIGGAVPEGVKTRISVFDPALNR